MEIKTINDRGFEYIRQWVINTRGEDCAGPFYLADDIAIEYWCRDAEESLSAGNPALIEMGARSTKSGRVETFIVPEDGITTNEIED